MTMGRTLTRQEAKAVTRRRLLDAAIRILDEEGDVALTTTSVTRLAGIAQSSFYVHFADMDELLHTLIDELALERRRLTRLARQEARDAPGNQDRLRATFRVPLEDLIAHGRVFRLLQRSRFDNSPLGEWSRSLLAGSRDALIEDLVAAGIPGATPTDRRRVAMVADGIIALTETFALGHLDGRYPDIEEIVDMLITFSHGYFPLLKGSR